MPRRGMNVKDLEQIELYKSLFGGKKKEKREEVSMSGSLLRDLENEKDRLMVFWQRAERLASKGVIKEEVARLIGEAWSCVGEAINELKGD